jgi:sugar phosphate isomerase/epimerase
MLINFIKSKGILLFVISIALMTLSCKNEKNKEANEMASNTTEIKAPFFKLSLAEWSLHKAIFDKSMDPLDFAEKAKEFGFEGLEYVSQLYTESIKEIGMDSVLKVLKSNSEKFGMQNVLIMVDGEGPMASTNEKERNKAVENHYKWVDAAQYLGCHSIRVNAHGEGNAEEVANAAVKGLTKLSEYAENKGINVLVENHGGYTSNGAWLADVMKRINRSNCGTLPDFGNFCQTIGYGSINDVNCKDPYDIYKGLNELMPYAKAVSAKSYDFDENGNQPKIDYLKMMQIVKDAGYTGFVGVEYEGSNKTEKEGIELTRDLLIKVGNELSN